jgi:hypothetical protein
MTTIKCNSCGTEIEITQALQGQIEAQVLAAEHEKHAAELTRAHAEAKILAEQAAAAAKQEADTELKLAKQQLAGEQDLLHRQAAADLELAKQKLELEAKAATRRASAEQELLVAGLKADAEAARADGQKLRQQLSQLMTDLRAERQAKERAELVAQQKLAEEEAKIRETATREAHESQRLNMAARDKTIADLQTALDAAQRKAAQGSQQLQGEVLELDLEQQLRDEFPHDDISEVKKGQRGADIKQRVRSQHADDICGTILWETKNGKWQPAWIPKFKADIREANANIGVIVSAEIPDAYGDLRHAENNVWVVTPRLATRLAAALRMTILQVDSANRMAAGKDAKMEALYQFLVGPEFKHRVEAIIESYTTLQDELEKEKRSYALKWARQEKAIRAVIDNTIGMYGDLQGITGRSLPTIKPLELIEAEVDE